MQRLRMMEECAYLLSEQFEDNLDIAATNFAERDGPDDAPTMNDDTVHADVNPEMEEDWDEDERLRQRINRMEDEKDAVKPLAIVGPFRVGSGLMSQSNGKGDDDPAYIVALTATPAHIPLPFIVDARRGEDRVKRPTIRTTTRPTTSPFQTWA